jgi:hypothetical protein
LCRQSSTWDSLATAWIDLTRVGETMERLGQHGQNHHKRDGAAHKDREGGRDKPGGHGKDKPGKGKDK